jgi:hypothetical protein
MKKFYLFLTLIAVVMLVGLTNCKKEDLNPKINYVGTVNGSFISKDVNVSTSKSLGPFDDPSLLTRNWIMYAINSPFYGNQPFALVKGLEFVQGSAAYLWWSTNGNNPISFAANQGVYSNLTPAEPVRLIMEGKNGNNEITYLGILDFNPKQAQFPLTVVSKRLGDLFTINTDELTKLPGANLTFTVKFNLAPVNVAGTELGLLSSATGANTTGVTGALDFSDILYGTPVSQTVTIPNGHNGSGDYPLYFGTDKKVFGDVVITITEAPSSSSPNVNGSVITLTVPAANFGLAGKGTKLVLHTTKLGWYDSQTISTSDVNVTVNVVNITLN